MKLYRIKNWDRFENFRSRQLNTCKFFCIPTKQDGLGYKILTSMPDGAALYGCFVAVCLIASKQRNPRQGFLTITGSAHDKPFSCSELSLKCNLPIGKLKRMLIACSSPRIGINWIECTPVMWLKKLNSRLWLPSTSYKSESSDHVATDQRPSSDHVATDQRPSSDHVATDQRPINPERTKERSIRSINARARTREGIDLGKIEVNQAGNQILGLLSRCQALFLETNELKNWHKRWYERASNDPKKLDRVLAHCEEFKRSGAKVLKSFPAMAEHAWREFK